MKLKMPNPTTPFSPKAAAPLDRRYAERAPLSCKVVYSGEEGARIAEIEGTLQDLSKTGCKILGERRPVMEGGLTLQLYIEDGETPLCLTGAHVTWVKGCCFAVQFPRLTSEERKRLQSIIWRNVRLSPASDHRTAFRIA
ncbi:MAG TPA: PilZ domain-containing protein [Nitrospiraceae bacterium]|jgi:hypothetical protein